jgi:Spy/CpxP family protein refolding chaperone
MLKLGSLKRRTLRCASSLVFPLPWKGNPMISLARRCLAVAVSAAALTILFSGLPLGAQEPNAPKIDAKSKAKVGKKTFDSTRRVPAYYAQLGLSDSQRESIYKIQGKLSPRIDALEKQIEALREQMSKECEAVLTPAQKKMLEQRRAAAAETRAKKSAPTKPQD